MFAVKGWSVSADKLKIEVESGKGKGNAREAKREPKKETKENGTRDAATDASAPSKNRKRKRPGNSQGPQNVTVANLASMWEKVIEQKEAPKAGSKPRRSRKEKRDAKEQQLADAGGAAAGEETPSGDKQENQASKDTSEKKKKTKNAPAVEEVAADDGEEEWGGFDDDEPSLDTAKPGHVDGKEKDRKKKKQKLEGQDTKQSPAAEKKPDPSAPPPPPAVKLTPLQASMREKLISARFRHLNETLYTRPSAEAFQLFQESPEMFSEYHEGFRRQVDVWPENPVESYIADIEARAKLRFPPKNVRHDFANPAASIRLLPLPRTGSARGGDSLCTIADLGCGDAALSAQLQPALRKLRLNIHSFDLQTGGSPLITRADVANLPLADGSVDVAIFCLALMGTNWVDFVEEAYRVLRWKGELWIAEIKSRFANPQSAKKNKVVAHSVGNRRNPGAGAGAAAPAPPAGKKTKKGREDAEAAAEAEEAELAVAVDGAELRRQETDITAFVDALRARGFLLHKELGAGAVDLSNKMFVKMHFVKAAAATKGKCVTAEARVENDRMGPQAPAKKPKFFTIDEEEEKSNEAAILKPCVYKLR